jgi:hypothetical protein
MKKLLMYSSLDVNWCSLDKVKMFVNIFGAKMIK